MVKDKKVLPHLSSYANDPERIEEQANRMAKEGWILEKFGSLFSTYRRGKAGEYEYRVQVKEAGIDRLTYIAELTEFGIEEVGGVGDLLVLRKKADGTPFDLYSDLDSLIAQQKKAVRYLRAHADEYGIDPERIGVIGDSAGGYLVQMLGATNGEKAFDKGDFTNVSSDVQAVCTIYGISDLTSIGEGLDPAQAKVHASPAVTEALLVHGPAFGKSPGGSILSDREKAMNASSLGHIDGSEPPFLIMHGSGDRLVSPMQSAHLAQALRKAGTDVEYVLVEGAGHGDLPWFQKPVIERVVKFFEKRLGSPAKDAAEGNNL